MVKDLKYPSIKGTYGTFRVPLIDEDNFVFSNSVFRFLTLPGN